jgi:hypothetical protein
MKTLLHIGCGYSTIKQTTSGFNDGSWQEIRFDIDAKNKPDIIGNMTDISAISAESIDAIFSSHNIEHLYFHEVFIALSEFKRVLKLNGFCIITCPDLQAVSALIANDKLLNIAYQSSAGPITPLDIFYGHSQSIMQGNYHMAHRCGFTKNTLSQVLLQNGFMSVHVIQRIDHFDLWAIACKANEPPDYLHHLAKLHFPASA